METSEGYPTGPSGREMADRASARTSARAAPPAGGARSDVRPDATARRPAGLGVARPRAVSRALLAWYAAEGRTLPIRRAADPWAVLVAEVMSQQTRIDRVGVHWERFIDAFPTPSALAAASLHDVVRAWSGLGYNRRAVALRDAAIAIVDRHDGAVPRTVGELTALPGVGPYTARAVAAIAFGEPVAAVDVNIRRLVERLVGSHLAPPDLQARADLLVDARRPAEWTHAAMDLAAMICRRRSPSCDVCPLARWCASRGTPGDGGRPRGDMTPFPATRRWLRGRLLAEIAAADAGAWQPIAGARGSHDTAAVRDALAGLAADGLVELDDEGRARVR